MGVAIVFLLVLTTLRDMRALCSKDQVTPAYVDVYPDDS